MFLILQKVINTFKCGLFPLKSTIRTGLKMLNLKKFLQRLPIVQQITKKVYNNIIKSIQL